jgi:hypothetical protein
MFFYVAELQSLDPKGRPSPGITSEHTFAPGTHEAPKSILTRSTFAKLKPTHLGEFTLFTGNPFLLDVARQNPKHTKTFFFEPLELDGLDTKARKQLAPAFP